MDFCDLKLDAHIVMSNLREERSKLLRHIADIDEEINAICFLETPNSRLSATKHSQIEQVITDFFKFSFPVYVSAKELYDLLLQTDLRQKQGIYDNLGGLIQKMTEQMEDRLERIVRKNGERAHRLKSRTPECDKGRDANFDFVPVEIPGEALSTTVLRE